MLHDYCCRYGLIIPNRVAKSKAVVNPVSVFGNDDDDDDQVCIDAQDRTTHECVLNITCNYYAACLLPSSSFHSPFPCHIFCKHVDITYCVVRQVMWHRRLACLQVEVCFAAARDSCLALATAPSIINPAQVLHTGIVAFVIAIMIEFM